MPGGLESGLPVQPTDINMVDMIAREAIDYGSRSRLWKVYHFVIHRCHQIEGSNLKVCMRHGAGSLSVLLLQQVSSQWARTYPRAAPCAPWPIPLYFCYFDHVFVALWSPKLLTNNLCTYVCSIVQQIVVFHHLALSVCVSNLTK